MNTSGTLVLDRLKQSGWLFWVVLFVLGALLALSNSLTTAADLTRNQVPFKAWEPYVWEFSSFLVIFALYVPLAWLARRYPLFGASWLKNLALHLLVSVAFSMCHVALMVLLRLWVYHLAGGHYDFGDWLTEWLYEYRKDLFTCFSFLLVYSLWQHWRQEPASPDTGQQLHRLKISNKNGTLWLPEDDIISIESGGNYIYFHSKDQVHPMRGTMKTILSSLDPHRFIRVHRSYIINTSAIRQLTDLSNDPCTLLLASGKQVPVSRTYRPAVQALLDQNNL